MEVKVSWMDNFSETTRIPVLNSLILCAWANVTKNVISIHHSAWRQDWGNRCKNRKPKSAEMLGQIFLWPYVGISTKKLSAFVWEQVKMSDFTQIVYGRNFHLYLMKSLACCCVVCDSTSKKNDEDEFRDIVACTSVAQYLVTQWQSAREHIISFDKQNSFIPSFLHPFIIF